MLKKFEEFESLDESEEPIDLVGYPEGNIIEVTEEEFEILSDEFDIKWDNEPDYEEGVTGQWRFMNEEEERIESRLFQLRDPVGWTAKKYNI